MGKKRYEEMTLEEKNFYNQLLEGIQRAELENEYEAARKSGNEQKELVEAEWSDYKSAYLYYRAKFEAIRDASFWRMTEPLRKAMDYYRWKKTGVRKTQFLDDISIAQKPNQTGKTLIGVHLHLYYEDLLDEFCTYFNNIPEKFDLYISCKKGAGQSEITSRANQIKNVDKVVVKETQNRGRDIAPFYVLFKKELQKYEYVLHVHSKKSLYTGGEKAEWRHEALDGVLKDEEMVAETLRLLRQADPRTGLVFGEMTSMLPPMALHWLYNSGRGSQLLSRMHIPFENHMLFYPVGSFFWAKTEAIRPLFDLNLSYQDFDEEKGQIDGTLAHALERVIACVVRNQGMNMYIFDPETSTYSVNKSYKCFKQYFKYNATNLADLLNANYDVITFDIFDTLITRLVYQPDDVFRLMERKIRSAYHIHVNYLKIRKEAERIAWEERGDYCNIHHIYEKLPFVSEFSAQQAEELKQMEIDLEYDLCIPRQDVLELFNRLMKAGKTILLISDMYLTESIIRKMLEKCGYQGYQELWVSCERGKRKDRDTIWDDFLQQYGTYRTIHIGDNPHSDCQIIGDRRRDYLLLLSPVEQFRLSKQYEKYANFVNTTVENSLVLGCFVNQCLYNSPFALRENGISKINSIRNVSQGVFAPILLQYIDYFHHTSHKDTILLFLAREGFFLEKLYKVYCEAFGVKELQHTYFLTSRRATSVAQIKEYQDLEELLKTKYSGKMSSLLKERFGLDSIRLDKDISVALPHDKAMVMKVLLDYVPELLQEAQIEKKEYMDYIHEILGEGIDWDKVTLLDVGYSGTIQYYLMKILETPLNGCYMVSGYTMKPEALDGTYRSLYSFWKSKRFLNTQLFLEAVTAAPHGQVVKFYKKEGKSEAILKPEKSIYGEKAAELQTPIYQYVQWLGSILKDIQPRFDKELAENIFSEILNKDFLDPCLRGTFYVNDGYCMDGDWIFNESAHDWELRRDKQVTALWQEEK